MTAPRLRAGIELLRGMDDLPLAYDSESGAYHRLSESAFRLLSQLDGVRPLKEIAPGRPATELEAFATALQARGVLDGAQPSAPVRRRKSRIMPFFILTRSLPRLLQPLAARVPMWIIWPLTALGVAGMAVALTTVGRQQAVLTWPIAVAALTLFAVQSVLHELAHALVAQVLRVPVRGAGFALLLWFMPFGFVDRTDAYRLRSRWQRVALAMAGPLTDGVIMGVTAWFAQDSDVAAYLLVVQIFALMMNLNPMLASDGYAAIEAATGLADLRGRALMLLGLSVRRRQMPPHLQALSPLSRVIHRGYGLLCVAYLGVLAYFALVGLMSLLPVS